MERLTEPGYEYHSCDFMDDGIYIDMNRLREYEDTGLTPDEINALQERDTAKEPEVHTNSDEIRVGSLVIGKGVKAYSCPKCGNMLRGSDNFCPECGQRLKREG